MEKTQIKKTNLNINSNLISILFKLVLSVQLFVLCNSQLDKPAMIFDENLFD